MAGRNGQVLIAGAGIGGLSAALALARCGARVTILERAADLAEIGAGLQISPNASRTLRNLGLLDGVSALATKPSGIRVRSARSGRTLSLMALGDVAERRWGAPYLVIRRADLQRVLAEAIAEDDAITLHLGTTLAGFAATDHGVQVTVKQTMLTRTFEADGLIGADGVRSAVRARLGGGTIDAPQETGRTAWRALIDRRAFAGSELGADLARGETGLWLGRDAHLVHYPIDGDRLVNVVAVTRDCSTTEPDADWSRQGDPRIVQARFADWHPMARALVAAAPAWSIWPLYDRAALPAWNAGPVALLGDAAHPILPFLAQGAAQAIEDAGALAEAYVRTRPIADAFARYSNARLARAARVQEASRRLGRVYHLGGAAALARDAAMRLIGGSRLLARYDWLYGF